MESFRSGQGQRGSREGSERGWFKGKETAGTSRGPHQHGKGTAGPGEREGKDGWPQLCGSQPEPEPDKA